MLEHIQKILQVPVRVIRRYLFFWGGTIYTYIYIIYIYMDRENGITF